MASMACRGAVSSGLSSRAACWLARLVTDRPRPAGRRGTRPSAVRSHQRVTGKGVAWLAASRSLISARSAISARFCPKTVGKLATDATISDRDREPAERHRDGRSDAEPVGRQVTAGGDGRDDLGRRLRRDRDLPGGGPGTEVDAELDRHRRIVSGIERELPGAPGGAMPAQDRWRCPVRWRHRPERVRWPGRHVRRRSRALPRRQGGTVGERPAERAAGRGGHREGLRR